VSKRIVIYTRYSSDMQREESCEDQEREVRAGLASRGIDARDAVVLQDKAESGTKANRAGFEQLSAMIARGEVAVLAVDDQSLLSRADNACAFITDLVYAGGRFISTGEGIDTAQDGWELRVKIMEVHNGATIRDLGRRVHRGQKGRVLDDGAAGDHPFGYESFYLDPNWAVSSRRGPKPKKGLRIYEAEALWVRRVFEWFVGGMAIAEIARELTRLGVDKGHKATTPGWHHQQVRRMLANPKYIGVWAWGATRTLRSSDGKTKQVLVPGDQRVVRERPDLRIIDQPTWEAAQKRLGELDDLYGVKPGQKPRGAKPHHTRVYPESLLGGLVHCHACGSRLWVQGGGGRAYLGCPAHRTGACAMASRVPVAAAERALLGFVAELLTAWPPWVEAAAAAMRGAIAGLAGRLPESLRADEGRLAELDRQVENLVDQLADGAPESAALRRRLDRLEREAEAVRGRIAEARRVQQAAVAVPDDAWLRAQLADLRPLLADDPRRAAPLLRRFFSAVTAEAVVAPGKRRGFIRLHVRLDAVHVLAEALGGRLPEAVLAAAVSSTSGELMGFQLDLGEPTRRDVLAPEIAALRARGVTWAEIGRVTGLGTGNAHNVWRRWADARPGDPGEGD
jgi:DNA invertase Pin-like site-specific DNA recombinase